MTPLGYAEPTDPRYVYTFLADDGSTLYVGCTVDLPRRLRDHMRKPYWLEVASIDATRYPNEAAGFAAEREAIRRLNPRYNSVHTDHAAPRATVCARCRAGNHRACLGFTAVSDDCPCSACVRDRALA